MNILDEYVTTLPSAQNAIDLFKSEWSSQVPGFASGQALLFEDPRVAALFDRAGGMSGKRALELGPLEGGHTFMLSQAGASDITSIESNQRAFLKCLITKELLGYKAHTLLGDFIPFLQKAKADGDKYDFLLASGVLYHMVDPVMAMDLFMSASNQIGIWTHFYDRKVVSSKWPKKFSSPEQVEYQGQPIEICRQSYETALSWGGFCGGSAPYSYWMSKDAITSMLSRNNFRFEILDEDLHHQNGPCMLLFAERQS